MFIQKCKSCSTQFKWTTILKSIWSGYKPIECVNCKTKHYPRLISRVIIAVCIPIPLLFQNFLYNSVKLNLLLVYFIWVFIVVLVSPLLVRYFIKE